MIKYIVMDCLSMIKYVPYGAAMGVFLFIAFLRITDRVGRPRGIKRRAVVPVMLFWVYVSVMLIITFFSRESGSRQGMDLELFSTWGINDRNNAYVVENVLLFIPYGFLGAWTSGRLRRILSCGVFGFLTSVGIESLQLVTRRGFFQIDDILTNTLGTVIGCGIFCIIFHNKKD